MCRLAAYIGAARPLADIVVKPRHSLLVQSQDATEAKLAVNGDGFGFAWYNNGLEPGLYKDILPAWSDANLVSLCTHISAPLFLAHVRASTDAETARANCHPFTWRNWSFMHNGQIGNFGALRRPLENSLSDEFYALRRGQTDSELVFLLLLQAGLERDPAQACVNVIRQITENTLKISSKAPVRRTCVISVGVALYAFRYASDGRCPTLYSVVTAGGVILASEPMDPEFGTWSEVEPNTLMRVDGEGGYRTERMERVASPVFVA